MLTESLLISFFGVIGAIILMILLRGFFLWYWGVKEITANQREIIKLLKGNLPADPVSDTWVCQQCQNENSKSDVFCKKCKSERP